MTEKPQSNEVRERILTAARKLFIEKGYDGTSIRDIAAESETNVAMVNYYFRSKFNLFEMIFGEAFEILMAQVSAILNSDRPFMEIVEVWIGTYYDVLLEYPQIPNFIFTAAHQNPEGLMRKAVGYNLKGIVDRVVGLIESEIARGTIKCASPIDLVINVVSLCVFPFVMGPLVREVAGKTAEEYEGILKDHKTYVINFVRDAIKA